MKLILSLLKNYWGTDKPGSGNRVPTQKTRNAPQSLGSYGEDLAADHLINSGFQITHRNWKCKIGELDLIALDNNEIVFIEVKTRTASRLAKKHLLDTIGYKKKKKLQNLAQVFIKYKFPEHKAHAYRIDVIGIIVSKDNFEMIELRHLKGVL